MGAPAWGGIACALLIREIAQGFIRRVIHGLMWWRMAGVSGAVVVAWLVRR